MICVGEHLDNLVYAHVCLVSREKTARVAKTLEEQIALLSTRIYGREHSPALLYQAWRLRDLDILEVLELERSTNITGTALEIGTVAADKASRLNAPARRAELSRIAEAARGHPLAYELFREWHQRGDKLDQLIEIHADWLSEKALVVLQTEVLRDLATTGIAIETLPTSNVRISSYDRLAEHHLFRWLNLTEDGFSITPAVCVGSDDTGIFATSLRNEYAAIYDVLRRRFSVGSEEAITTLEKLNRNGAAYRFRPLV